MTLKRISESNSSVPQVTQFVRCTSTMFSRRNLFVPFRVDTAIIPDLDNQSDESCADEANF